jgi:hypothetical protein
MKFLKKFLKPKDLPEVYKNLIDVIRRNHESSGGENRAAIAELQARSAWELNRATKGLRTATWILAASTFVLCIVTWAKS